MVVERKVPRREEEDGDDRGVLVRLRRGCTREKTTPASVFRESPRSRAFRPRPNNPTCTRVVITIHPRR